MTEAFFKEIITMYGPLGLFVLAWYLERKERQTNDSEYRKAMAGAIQALEGFRSVMGQVLENTRK